MLYTGVCRQPVVVFPMVTVAQCSLWRTRGECSGRGSRVPTWTVSYSTALTMYRPSSRRGDQDRVKEVIKGELTPSPTPSTGRRPCP